MKISYASWKSLIANIFLSLTEGKDGRDGRDGKIETKVGVKIWTKKWMTNATTQNGKKMKERWRECSIKSQTAFKLKEYCLQNSEFELNHMHILGKFTGELNFICRDWNRLLTSYIDVIWAKSEVIRLLSIINTYPWNFDDSLSSCWIIFYKSKATVRKVSKLQFS